jgi:hypothetical protein
MQSCPQFKNAPRVSKGPSRTIVFVSAGSETPESLLMSINYSPATAQCGRFVWTHAKTSFSSRRHDRAARPAEHWAGNQSGTTASERPPATRSGTVFPPFFYRFRVHRPSPRPPVQDDCKQVHSHSLSSSLQFCSPFPTSGRQRSARAVSMQHQFAPHTQFLASFLCYSPIFLHFFNIFLYIQRSVYSLQTSFSPIQTINRDSGWIEATISLIKDSEGVQLEPSVSFPLMYILVSFPCPALMSVKLLSTMLLSTMYLCRRLSASPPCFPPLFFMPFLYLITPSLASCNVRNRGIERWHQK